MDAEGSRILYLNLRPRTCAVCSTRLPSGTAREQKLCQKCAGWQLALSYLAAAQRALDDVK